MLKSNANRNVAVICDATVKRDGAMKKIEVLTSEEGAAGLRHPDGEELESQWCRGGCDWWLAARRQKVINIDRSCLDSI